MNQKSRLKSISLRNDNESNKMSKCLWTATKCSTISYRRTKLRFGAMGILFVPVKIVCCDPNVENQMDTISIKILKPNFHILFIEVIKLWNLLSVKAFDPFFHSLLFTPRIHHVRMTNYFMRKSHYFIVWATLEGLKSQELTSFK